MAASIKVPTVFTAEDKFTAVIRKMSSGVKSWTRQTSAAVDRFDQKVTRSFNRLGNLTQLALGVGVGAIFLGAFNDIKTFETGIVGVSKTTGIVGDDLKELTGDFIDLSDKMRGVSASKLVDIGQVAGQLGVTGSENILKFSGTIANLEKASDIAGEEGAASIARLLTITGEGVGEIDKFGAAIVGLGNSSAASESEILSVASEVGRATAAYKLQAREILGISTTLKSLDVRPEAAGTAVGKVFRGIEMATINGGKVLHNYGKVMGMTSDQVKKAFAEDPQKAFSTFIGGLNRISNEGGSLAGTLESLGLSGETVSKGIIPLATNYDLLTEKVAQSNKEWEKNTALQNEADAASKTIQTAIDDIKKSFTNLILKQATAGSGLSKFQDILFFVSDNMGILLGLAASLIGTFVLMKAIVWGTKIATTAYNIALGINTALTQKNKRALIGNTIAQGAYKVAMGIGTAVTWVANSAFVTLAASVLAATWPILAVIAAVLAVVYIFLYWDEIVQWFSKKWTQFTEWISKAWASVIAFFQDFSFEDMFRSIGESILKFMLEPIKGVLWLLSKMPGKLGDLAKSGLDKVKDIQGNISLEKGDGNGILPSTTQTGAEVTKETIQSGRLDINLNDPGNNVQDVKKSGNLNMPVVGPTQGQR